MLPISAIANKFSMAKDKLSYFINFGFYPLPFQYLKMLYIVGQAQLMDIEYVFSSQFDYLWFMKTGFCIPPFDYFMKLRKSPKLAPR